MKIKYRPFKNSPIIVFLDTNSIIEMSEGIISRDINHRGNKIFCTLKKAVKDKKIICPFVYQRNEYFVFFDKDKNKTCDDVLFSLSNGKQVTINQEKIFESQFKRMALLFLDNKKDFYFEESDIFNAEQNSESELEKKYGFKLTIINSGFKYPNQDEVEVELVKIFEERRKKIKQIKMSKEQLFEEERRGRFYDLIKNDQERVDYYKSINPKSGYIEEYSLMQTKMNVFNYWMDILKIKGVDDLDFSKFQSFLMSEYFLSIPLDHISALLYTELLFDNKPFRKTDIRDIVSISVIFPYATIALIDGEMQGYVYKNNINNIFHVDVFSLKSYDKFIKKIESL